MSVGVREMAKNSVANASPLAERLCQNSTARRTSRLFTPTITEHQFSRNGVRSSSLEARPSADEAGEDCPERPGPNHRPEGYPLDQGLEPDRAQRVAGEVRSDEEECRDQGPPGALAHRARGGMKSRDVRRQGCGGKEAQNEPGPLRPLTRALPRPTGHG